MKTNPNDPVCASEYQWGLTKRELFAAMAMQGLLVGHPGISKAADYAGDAIMYADALIDELNKGDDK